MNRQPPLKNSPITGVVQELGRICRRSAASHRGEPNFFEWDAVMNETTPAEKWATSVYLCRGLRVALRRHGSAWMAHPLITVGGRKFHAHAVVVSPSDLAGSAEQTRIK
jgi:hypothetical protein